MRSAKAASLGDGASTTPPPPDLLEEVAATNQQLDYDSIVNAGPWVIWRKSSGGETGLNFGSVVRLALIPRVSYDANNTSGVKHFPVQITKVYRLADFTVYEGEWLEMPTGVEHARIAFTSADIISVVSRA